MKKIEVGQARFVYPKHRFDSMLKEKIWNKKELKNKDDEYDIYLVEDTFGALFFVAVHEN